MWFRATVASLVVLCACSVAAQDIRTAGALYLREAEARFGLREFYSTFPNIDQPGTYLDRTLLREMQDLEARGDRDALDRLLTAYVRNFAVRNFSQDVSLSLVWKLAQLSEFRRDTAKAIYYYSIALRNQGKSSEEASKIRVSYDTLRSPWFTPYVDLDYYYDLVSARRKVDTLVPPRGVLLNMGDHINSPAPDYAPYMHPSNSVLIFTSRRDDFGGITPGFSQAEDLYFTQKSVFGEGWENAQRFGDIINSPFNEGSACLNRNATELYFTRCNAPGSLGVCDIYMASYVGGKWENVRNLGPNVNSADWESHPHISPDDKWLYFSSNRSGGFGRTDLYRCPRNSDGSWGPAVNLGPMINTIDEEVTPFLHPINQTLYFSSRGHLNNNGGFDIYKTRWKLNHWTEPANLGPLVNSRGDEYYFSIDGKGERLFYAAARREDKDNLDVYSFPMPMNARPDAVVKLQGYLIDSVSGQPVTGIITAVDQSEGTEVAPIYTSRTGYFEFELVGNRKYVLVVLGNNAVTIRENVPLTVDTLVNIFSRNLPTGRPIVFETLEFQKNSAEIERQTIPRIKLLGDFLKKYPEVRVTIRGHTDADGDADFNLQLSQERAENIRRLLLRSSAQADTFVRAEGYGESRPVFPNDSPEHKAVNRRVEFELTIPPKYRSKLGVETLVFDDRTTGALEERLGEDELDEPIEPAAEAEDALDPETDAMLGDLEEESIDDFSGMLGELLDEIDDDMATRRDTTALDSSATDSLGRPIKRPSTRAPAKPDVVGKKTDKPPAKPINKKEEEEEEDMEDLDDEGDG